MTAHEKESIFQNEQEVRLKLATCEKDLHKEKQKNTSLFFIIGGVLCFELGRMLQVLHELVAMVGSVTAVILSLYGIFHYFEVFTKSSHEK
ncbi:hypothetical protein ACFL27_21780 [candidate division CSSED10-310 bacterium]|uniref:DUF202 domain-containing protein n=1 Tax=candidate division CSSED10-310 bacterium TaxID=2855610 RepID=A0ABV6Z2Z9_UNCC1